MGRGRRSQIKQPGSSGLEANNPGCMWGMLFFLDYHRWYNIKRMLPHRRHGSRNHVKCCGNPKTISLERDTFETQALLYDEANHFPVKKSGHKSFGKADTKQQVNKKTLEERNGTQNPSEISFKGSSLQKNEETIVPVHLEKELDRVLKRSLSQNQVNVEQMREKFMKHEDVFEVFKVSKEQFLKVLQSTYFHEQHNSNANEKFTKSRSFPVSKSRRARLNRLSTLKHKQSEVWSFRKRWSSSVSSIQDTMSVESLSPSDFHEKPVQGQEKKLSSLDVSQGSINQGWNQLVISRFRHIKKRIRHIFKETKKDSNHTSDETVFRRATSPESSQDMMNQTGNSGNNSGKGETVALKRISSLNESLDKYTSLFERGFNRSTALRESRSLKLASEERSFSHNKRSFKRNLSVPNLGPLCPYILEVPCNSLPSGIPVEAIFDHFRNNEIGIHIEENPVSYDVSNKNLEAEGSVANSELQEKIDCPRSFEADSLCDENSRSTDEFKKVTTVTKVEEIDSYIEQDSVFTMNSSSELASDSRSCFPVERSNLGEFSVIKASESNTTAKSDDGDHLSLVSEKKTTANSLGFWHSMETPLDPTVIKELENNIQLELEGSMEEGQGKCDPPLLFDLVNEVLIEIYERSYTYFPRPFIFNSRSRAYSRLGQNLVEEVWKKVDIYSSLQPELDESLDHVMVQDFARDDVWMDLQGENECVVLEVEDWIFDELLEEIITS